MFLFLSDKNLAEKSLPDICRILWMAKQLKIYKDKPLIMAGESMEEKQGMWYEKVSRELNNAGGKTRCIRC